MPSLLRVSLAVAVLAAGLSGCIGDQTVRVDGPDGTAGEQPLDIYAYRWPDDAQAPAGETVGWAVRLANPSEVVVDVHVATTADRHGPVRQTGWEAGPGGPDGTRHLMAPDRPVLWLFEAHVQPDGTVVETTLTYERGGVEVGRTALHRNLTAAPGDAVVPGMHVQTATVGLWANGTSFYTNLAALDSDPAFPAGYDRSGFGGAPLSVYVYDQDRSEQPPRSRDTCHATTIPGYNALLKTQQEGSTGVRFLAPDEAYTRQGNEGHFLYGHALIFVNTVIAIDGTTGPEDQVPDPTADCFDAEGYVPPIPPIAPLWRAAAR